jgi:hypothetical protein
MTAAASTATPGWAARARTCDDDDTKPQHGGGQHFPGERAHSPWRIAEHTTHAGRPSRCAARCGWMLCACLFFVLAV